MYFLLLVLSCSLFLLSSPAKAVKSYCNDQELTVFACSIENKTVSVCSSKDISPTTGYLQYRFGKGTVPELILPKSIEPGLPRTNIQARILMFSGGGGSYLRFINGRYHYIVYTAVSKSWGTKDGISVEQDGKLISNLPCQAIPVSMMGEVFFTKAGLANDKVEFDLP